MIIKNMRWGYDGGGFACGPMEGSTYLGKALEVFVLAHCGVIGIMNRNRGDKDALGLDMGEIDRVRARNYLRSHTYRLKQLTYRFFSAGEFV